MADSYTGKGEIYINGRIQAEATEFTATVNSNDTQVITMIKGATGFSDGAATSEASITSAIPKKGFESSFLQHVADKKDIKIVQRVANQRVEYVGRFTTSQVSVSATGVASISGTFQGGAPKFIG